MHTNLDSFTSSIEYRTLIAKRRRLIWPLLILTLVSYFSFILAIAFAPAALVSACSAACGTGAIVFGDLNDKKSKVRGLADSDRSYHMLEEIGVKPNVNYLVKVRNTDEAAAHHA